MCWEAGASTLFPKISAGTSRLSSVSLRSSSSRIIEVIPETSPALVSAQWLKERFFDTSGDLISQENNIRVNGAQHHPLILLDANWQLELDFDGYEKHYKGGHIPGAVFFDLDALGSLQSGSQQDYPIPDPSQFERFVSELGVTKDTHVITYDSTNTRSAARVWFLFRLFGHDRVSVLDGGLRRWLEEGHQVCTSDCQGACQPDQSRASGSSVSPTSARPFRAVLRSSMLRNFAEMLEILETEEAQIIDCRPEACLTETDSSVVTDIDSSVMTPATTSTGHPSIGYIPGAINIPFTNFVTSEGTLKSEEELYLVFESSGVDLSVPAVVYCQEGKTSCTVALAAFMCGIRNLPIYMGSWAEWSKLAPSSLIATKKKV
ncbi:sulfurtransferase [Elysia marginata]|uniref:Sulfurtransferase n=1 Tax=Elysia marginata TaxID=1093978 RepID=A0AAV4JQK4_9GAST|nr:sulfurtransferase [Elysia marginata]